MRKKNDGMFYGWVLLAVISLCYFLGVGLCMYGLSVVLPLMIEEFGWSRGQASVGFSLLLLVWGVSAPLVSIFIRRFSTRKTYLTGGILIVCGALLIYQTSSLYIFYLGTGFFIAIGLSMTSVLPGSNLLVTWFVQRRALAMGLFMANGGLGGFVASPMVAALVEQTGNWRIVWLLMAVCGLLVGLLGFWAIRERPEEIGQHPDGVKNPAEAHVTATSTNAVFKTSENWTLREALRTRFFWLTVLVACAATTAAATINAHLILHLSDIGVSSLVAASSLGMVAILNSTGRILSGGIGDRIDPRWILAAGMAFQAIGFLLLNFATSQPLVYLFTVLFGMGIGVYLIALTALTANYFGALNFSAIAAIQALSYTLVAASGPIAAGAIFDRTGSYQTVFISLAALTALCALCVGWMKPPVRSTPSIETAGN